MRQTPPNQFRVKDLGQWSSTNEDCMNGAFRIPLGHNTTACCIVSDGKPVEGYEQYAFWEHVSVHIQDRDGKERTPSWSQMCVVKDFFWEQEECVVQFHPPKSEYVNNHPHVLHLWKWIGGDFPRPPGLLVGIKDLGVIA